MATVSVNPPKTPVTKGSNGIAAATVPNICKMPGPPAPFVPTPLPNIGKSGNSPDGYSKNVKFEGKEIAIKGATFKSMGDIASKGTGGGMVSANTEGPTKFVGPGSMDVKIEGKNVQLLSDPMLNNCGGSGSPPNAATMMGILQITGSLIVVPGGDKCPVCGDTHEDFKEDDNTTKDKAKDVAQAYKKEIEKKHITDKTMIGVACCKCSKPKYYAAKSGSYKADSESGSRIPIYNEFKKAAGGCIIHQETTHNKMFNEQFNKGKALFISTPYYLKLKDILGETKANMKIQEMQDARKKGRDGGPTAYRPGQCAGPKVLLLALDDAGIPGALTEQWFSSGEKPTDGPVKYKKQVRNPDTNELELVDDERPFEHGKSVPPCATCEVILPILICPKDRKCH